MDFCHRLLKQRFQDYCFPENVDLPDYRSSELGPRRLGEPFLVRLEISMLAIRSRNGPLGMAPLNTSFLASLNTFLATETRSMKPRETFRRATPPVPLGSRRSVSPTEPVTHYGKPPPPVSRRKSPPRLSPQRLVPALDRPMPAWDPIPSETAAIPQPSTGWHSTGSDDS